MIRQILKEAKENNYLDISIKNVDKAVKKPEDILYQNIEVFGKYDGTKLSIIRTDSPWVNDSWNDLFIVSYKGNRIYPEEFLYAGDDIGNTIGVSQYKKVFDHINSNWKSWKQLPLMTEFFFEFLMNKPTLTRSYTKIHQLILIAYSKLKSFEETNGKIKTNPEGFFMESREKYAEIFTSNLPELLFRGKLVELPRGLNSRALEYFNEYEEQIKSRNLEISWEAIRAFFGAIPSIYGSPKEEGVVIHLEKPISGTTILKIVQNDQYDKNLRFAKKQQYQMEPENENEYWILVREVAKNFINELNLTKKLNENLKILSKLVYKSDISISHQKKSEQNVRDDILLTAKSMLIRLMPGNNGALIIGKFRILTRGHIKMFEKALKEYDTISVAVVSSKETKQTLDIRVEMIKKTFPEVEIIKTTSGNLITIINRSENNINAVIAGTDRVKNYQEQLKRNQDVEVKEIKRTDDDESATKVIKNIHDEKYFKKNTPREIHSMYKKLLEIYG